jgi:DNA-binding transcriptional regulator YbjK
MKKSKYHWMSHRPKLRVVRAIWKKREIAKAEGLIGRLEARLLSARNRLKAVISA